MSEDLRKHVVYLINRFRSSHDLPPLHLDQHQSELAKKHSEHRVDRMNEVAKGPLPWHTESHLHGGWSSENVGHVERPEHERPYQLAEEIFHDWLEKPTHRQNILNAKHRVGIDIAHRQAHGKRRVFMTGRFW